MTGESKSNVTPIINAHSSTFDQGKAEHLVSGFLNGWLSSTVVLSFTAASTLCITSHSSSSTSFKEELLL